MGTSDPRFVRLRDGVSLLVDMDGGSGWSISGFDVKEFPDDDDRAEKFVRASYVAGKLVEASSDEYDALHPEGSDESPPVVIFKEAPSNWEENKIQDAAKAQRKTLRQARGLEPGDPEPREGAIGETDNVVRSNSPSRDEAADAERRAANIAEQEETGQLTNDPDEQKARSTGQKASRSRSRSSKVKEKEEESSGS